MAPEELPGMTEFVVLSTLLGPEVFRIPRDSAPMGGVGSLGGLSPVAKTRALDTMASAVGEETWSSSTTPSKTEATCS
jgi:hypothetical protein